LVFSAGGDSWPDLLLAGQREHRGRDQVERADGEEAAAQRHAERRDAVRQRDRQEDQREEAGEAGAAEQPGTLAGRRDVLLDLGLGQRDLLVDEQRQVARRGRPPARRGSCPRCGQCRLSMGALRGR
jgi:hypothetical protein